MKNLIKATVITALLSLVSLYAHGGKEEHDHNHDCKHTLDKDTVLGQIKANKADVEKRAKQKIQKLVSKKRIPKSWKEAKIAKIGKTSVNDTKDWEVSFKNLKIKDKTKQTLYIFVSVYGDIVGVNYTGK